MLTSTNKMRRIVILSTSLIVNILYIWIVGIIESNFDRRYANHGLGLFDNAIMWILGLLFMVIPILVAGIPATKTQDRPTAYYGFIGAIGGALIAWLTFDPIFGLYSLFACGLVTLVSFNGIVNPEIKIPNIIYFAVLGCGAVLVNAWFIDEISDVYTYLMFVFLHLLPVIICGMKKMEWAWAYIYGWDIGAIVSIFVFNALAGGYLLVVPHFLIWVVLIYVNKVWRARVKINQ